MRCAHFSEWCVQDSDALDFNRYEVILDSEETILKNTLDISEKVLYSVYLALVLIVPFCGE
jgi:hypothetical protein